MSDYGFSSDEVEFDDEFDDMQPVARDTPCCTVMSAGALRNMRLDAQQQVMSVWGLAAYEARALLMTYNWNIEKLQDALGQDQETVFRRAGLISHSTSKDNVAGEGDTTLTCGSCLTDDVPLADCTTMACDHSFCNDCWKSHFMIQIESGKSRQLRCMSFKCGVICDDDVVTALLTPEHPDVAAKFKQRLDDSFVDDNRNIKWCTSTPHCGNSIHVKDLHNPVETTCSCSQCFCFSCTGDAHSPASCEMYKQWETKCQDDSETKNWLNSNTKLCPGCEKSIEKNRGCNLVVCICGQAFCWLCGGATGRSHTWTTIKGHSCGRYKQEEYEKKAEQCKSPLARYLHYYKHWRGHLDSFALESERYDTLREHIGEREMRGDELADHGWVYKGHSQLVLARRILAYSYVFAFYAFDKILFDNVSDEQNTINQNLFEDKQVELEHTIEALSKMLDDWVAQDDNGSQTLSDQTRQQTLGLMDLTDKRCGYLYDVVANDLLGQLEHTLQTKHRIATYVSPSPGVRLSLPPNTPGAPSASKRPADVSPRTLERGNADATHGSKRMEVETVDLTGE